MRTTIRVKLITIFILVVAIPVTLVGVQAYLVSQESMVSRIGKSLERQADRMMGQIDRMLFERYQNVLNWSEDAIMLDLKHNDSNAQISQFLTTMQREYGLYTGIVAVNLSGQVIAASHPRLLGVSVAETPWFKASLGANDVHAYALSDSEVFGGVSLIFAGPVQLLSQAPTPGESEKGESGELLGVLAAALNWSEILNLVNTAQILEQGEQTQAAYALLIDDQGYALTQPFFDDRELMLARNVFEDGADLPRPPENLPSGYSVGGDLYGHQALMGWAWSKGYRSFRGLGWGTLMFQRAAEALQPIRALKGHILASSLLVVALVILVSLIVTRRMTQPILQMARVASRVSKGDFDARVTQVPGDEVGALALVFNQMIMDLKQQRAQLVERAFVDNVLESMLNSLIVADSEGRIRTVNQATCALLGYTEQDLIGQPLARVAEGVLSEDGKYREQHNVECVYRTKNGKRLPVLFSSALLRDSRGTMQGVVCVAQDLTERHRAEAALRAYAQDLARSNAELEQFAYVASHDLQEPLRMVASYTQLLARRYKGRLDADADEFIAFAVDAATRMQRLINDLLAYSRVGTRGKPFEPTNLSNVMKYVLTSLQLAIEESGARISMDSLPTLMADPVQMGQLFQNLLGNALKFRKTDSPLDIRVTASLIKDEWLFTVADNGIGFDPEYSERIFVIFQRLHTVSEYPGTGIGLAICKKIVERHGGRIWADSAPGQGAVFSFTLPLEPPQERHV
jgi:PAS domain S-box-containing protein